MADKMSFTLVSPERQLASGEADMVVIPGMEGDLGAMPGHAPFLTTLRPGLVTVTDGGSATEYFVTGGFAEVSPEGVAILAEEAKERVEVSADWLTAKMDDAAKALEGASDDSRRAAQQLVDDLKAAEAALA